MCSERQQCSSAAAYCLGTVLEVLKKVQSGPADLLEKDTADVLSDL
jgi:hypothetical protein